MLRKTFLVAATLFLAQTNVRAAEPIECAFGICFGKSTINNVLTRDSLGNYKWIVDPPIVNPKFKKYLVTVVPSSSLIASVVALSEPSNCDSDFDEMRPLLVAKYGTPTQVKNSNTFDLLTWIRNGRRIQLMCDRSIKTPILSLGYADDALIGQMKREVDAEKNEQSKKGL